MIFALILTGEDDIILLALILLVVSIIIIWYFISIDTWEAKKNKSKKNLLPYDKLENNYQDSEDFTQIPDMYNKNKKGTNSLAKNRSLIMDLMRPDAISPPLGSPFQSMLFVNSKKDAYLHPCAKKFSTEEVKLGKENSYTPPNRFRLTRNDFITS